VAVTIVLLTERALGDDDASRLVALHGEEVARYHVLVPADPHRSVLADVLDHLSLFELRAALDAARGREEDETPSAASAILNASVAALRDAGAEADGEVTQDEPLPALRLGVSEHSADEVVVVTRPHAVEDTFHTDWASQARENLGVPVLHMYAGLDWLG
jgi:hypothetical protein